MSFIKYRVKEVAADFGVTPKEISDVIGKFYERPKSYTQVLNDQELNVVFDYMTQKNQIKSLEQVFAMRPAPKAEPAKAEPQKAPAQQPAQPRQQNQQGRPQNPNQPRQQNQQGRPQNNNQPQNRQQPQQPAKPAEPERKRERRVVDTSAVQVNSNRFADVDNLVSERPQRDT